MNEKAKKKKGSIADYFKRPAFKTELVTLAAAVLMGRINVMNGIAPFGIAFLAACAMTGLNVHYALPGVLLGAALLQGTPHVQSVCTCALYYALLLAWRRWKKNCGRFDKLILLFLAQVTLLPVFFRNSLSAVLQGLISLGVSALAALIIQNAAKTLLQLETRHVLSDGEQLSISVFFGLALLSVSDVSAFGFSLPVSLLLLYAMLGVLARGAAGVAMAVALAAVLSIGSDFSLTFVGSIAACALAGAALRSLDTLGIVGGFVGCSLIVGTYVYSESHTVNLLNLAISGSVFLVIPRNKMLQLCAYFDAQKDRERYAKKALKRMRASTADELIHTAQVCKEMACLYRAALPVEEPSDALMQWTAQAAYGACGDCPLKHPCWKDWKKAAETVLTLLQALEKGERIRIRRPFDPSCRQMQQLASAAWQAQNQYLVQRAMKSQTNQQYGFINRQLNGICDVLELLADRIRHEKWLDEEAELVLLRGLDRRGYRVHGADVTFPEDRLRIEIRAAAEVLTELDAFASAVQTVMRREIRVLTTEVDGKNCRILLEEAQQLVASMGAACAAVSRTGVSGDSVGERRMERGRVLYALSDGMGAGEEAKGESDSALRLLFDLYDAGFTRDVALESVNRLLLERRADMYATLDAVFLDLRSGEAEFMKYGAPPSYLYRGVQLHEVRSEALPAGIVDEAVPSISLAKLKRQDTLFLFTDGALDALGGQLTEAIRTAVKDTKTCQEAAQALLERACAGERADDMTVMVIRIA